MKEKISVLVVNFNSSDFIELSLFALEKLTKNPYKVYIVETSPDEGELVKIEKIVNGRSNVEVERWETELRGSMQHGTALNLLTRKVETPYFAILDADATFLKKDWDEILISELTQKEPVIGTQAPVSKPQDFPLMFAALFRTKEFKELNIDFRPKDIEAKQDTGFEMREKYLDSGYNGKNITYLNTRSYKKGPLARVICGEYYLDGYNDIFASHFGRGSTLGANKYKSGWKRFFYDLPLVGESLKRRKGRQEKKYWINTCKNIINNQL